MTLVGTALSRAPRSLAATCLLLVCATASPTASARAPELIDVAYKLEISFACKSKLDFEVRVEPSGEIALPGHGKLAVADKTAAAALFAIQRAFGEPVKRVVVKPTPNEKFSFERPTPPCR